jgi:serine/alanine adding enzyme
MSTMWTTEVVLPHSTRDLQIELLGPGELPCGDDDPQRQTAWRWLAVLQEALRHEPYCVSALAEDGTRGMLPLALVKSALFGRFLVSLPYVNSAGVQATNESIAARLLDEAVRLADRLNVRYLEIRQERETPHPALKYISTAKVLMRLPLPQSVDALWTAFNAKLRNRIRAGQKFEFDVAGGGQEVLDDFYRVFSQNMRDLGTPVYSRKLFESILNHFASQAELCVLRKQGAPIAGALLMHLDGRSEVPSASSLRSWNHSNANTLMYWHLLSRAIERGQPVFDFGRSSPDSGTYRFKDQWGARPSPSIWQYYLRHGSIEAMRPDNARFGLAIKVWQRLPVALTRWIGPTIVRGIP